MLWLSGVGKRKSNFGLQYVNTAKTWLSMVEKMLEKGIGKPHILTYLLHRPPPSLPELKCLVDHQTQNRVQTRVRSGLSMKLSFIFINLSLLLVDALLQYITGHDRDKLTL